MYAPRKPAEQKPDAPPPEKKRNGIVHHPISKLIRLIVGLAVIGLGAALAFTPLGFLIPIPLFGTFVMSIGVAIIIWSLVPIKKALKLMKIATVALWRAIGRFCDFVAGF